jgi:hypothetical protein
MPRKSDHRLMAIIKVAVTLGCALGLNSESLAETRGYAIGWFTVAVWSEQDDCPNGLNPDTDEMYRRIWAKQGKTPTEIAAYTTNRDHPGGESYDGMGGEKGIKEILFRGRTPEGEPANVFQYPESVPDPNISLVAGKYARGFNLDGKGTDDPKAFEEPTTHERGIDNNLMRIYGCFPVNRAKPPDRPTSGGVTMWGDSVSGMPAWLLTISGDDLSKDGKVTVTIQRGLTGARFDSRLQPYYQTFRADPDPRWRNVFQGEIKNHMLTTTGDTHFQMPAESYFIPDVDISQAQLRLELKPDGALDGIVGGYLRWMPAYWGLVEDGIPSERFHNMDFTGVYYAYKKLADADPDPTSGLKRRISSAFRIEAAPAFVIPAEQSTQAIVRNER